MDEVCCLANALWRSPNNFEETSICIGTSLLWRACTPVVYPSCISSQICTEETVYVSSQHPVCSPAMTEIFASSTTQVQELWHDAAIAAAALAARQPAFRAALSDQGWVRELAALSEDALRQRLGSSPDVASPAERLLRALT